MLCQLLQYSFTGVDSFLQLDNPHPEVNIIPVALQLWRPRNLTYIPGVELTLNLQPGTGSVVVKTVVGVN